STGCDSQTDSDITVDASSVFSHVLENLSDNGGRTETHALIINSPAIDGAHDDDCLSIDQRGLARPAGSGCGMGAFELESFSFQITITGTGSGRISSTVSTLNCETDCSGEIYAGTVVTLTAVPEEGSRFVGWTGACTGTEECVVTVAEINNVGAIFEPAIDRIYLPAINR
ncbi:MAG: choice-of-anchor Q domain-containing protein, partial [Chloroflexota bacterium]